MLCDDYRYKAVAIAATWTARSPLLTDVHTFFDSEFLDALAHFHGQIIEHQEHVSPADPSVCLRLSSQVWRVDRESRRSV